MVFCEQANKTRGDGVRGKCPIFHSKGYSMRDNMAGFSSSCNILVFLSIFDWHGAIVA